MVVFFASIMLVFFGIVLPCATVLFPWLKQFQPSCALPRTRRPKVVHIGMPRTCSTSLSAALERCGYRTWHSPPMSHARGLANWASKFDALTDLWSTCARDYQELFAFFPGDTLFVLTVRDPHRWLRSTKTYRALAKVARWVPGYGHMERMVDQLTTDRFVRYNEEVQAFFAEQGASNRLLVMNIEAGDGWDALCPFLGVHVRQESFPKTRELVFHVRQSFRYPCP